MGYLLFNNNYPVECRFEEKTLEDVKWHLKDMFQTSFTIVADNDPRLQDTFLFCSESRYNSIDSMNLEELKAEFKKEYGWTLENN